MDGMYLGMKFDNYIQGTLDFSNSEINDLTKYGIFEEKSNIRAHVTHQKVYVFKTIEVIKYLNNKSDELNLVPAYQPNYDEPTAYGYLIKPDVINDIRQLRFVSWSGWKEFDDKWSTTEKGNWAVKCITELIIKGRFPFWIEAKRNNNITIDIEGTDILIVMDQRIQVKCDYPAYRTGNLFIQTYEKNPFKLY